MTPQEAILRACAESHPLETRTSDVRLARGAGWLRVCSPCWNASVAARRAARKAELAALPRCEVPRCKRRLRYRVGADAVGLCGAHLTACRRHRSRSFGPMAIVAWLTQAGTDRAAILRFAQGAPAPRADDETSHYRGAQ